MMTAWRETTLGEICDQVSGVIQTGPFGSQLHESDYSIDGIPVVMPKDIVEGRISTESVARVATEHVNRLARHKLKCGDIVYGRRGDIGRQALIRSEQNGWLCGTGCLRISLGDSVVEPTFLHYYLRQESAISWISGQAVGATMPNLNTGILRSVPVHVPPLATQRRIAGILSAYDKLIENNQRRIRILEDMARSLYREWFVRFRYPGCESIPLVDTSIGQIPQGWGRASAPDCIAINPRVTVPRDGDKPFVPMGCLSNDSMLISDIESRSGNSGAKFQNGDTLFARITPCLENGKTGFVQFLPTSQDVAFGSTEFIVLRSRTLTPEFVYCLARSDEFRNAAIKSMSGATGRQRVQEKSFDAFPIAQPTRELLDRFTGIVAPNFRLIYGLHHQIENLRCTRDLLLPRLLSGQVALAVSEPEFNEVTL
jgi:type I restriction enzyme S subunit